MWTWRNKLCLLTNQNHNGSPCDGTILMNGCDFLASLYIQQLNKQIRKLIVQAAILETGGSTIQKDEKEEKLGCFKWWN